MAIIDWEQFNENFQYYDTETIREVIGNFFEEYEERLSVIGNNISENNFSQLAFHAHSMKSVIGNFMAPAPYELCREIEEIAKQNSSTGVPELFSELKEQILELKTELTDYLQK